MITVIAVICSLSAPDICRQQVVTTSDFAEISMTSCLMGAPQLAEWMRNYPGYRLASWKCAIGAQKEHA